MPSKKREVHAFVARLNPFLVRTVDAYAIQCNLSRNQAVEVLLDKCFRLADEVQMWRENERQRQAHDLPDSSESAGDVFERVQFETEQNLDYQRLVAARKIAKNPGFEFSSGDEETAETEKKTQKRKGKRSS